MDYELLPLPLQRCQLCATVATHQVAYEARNGTMVQVLCVCERCGIDEVNRMRIVEQARHRQERR